MKPSPSHGRVFVSGGTGYLGRAMIPRLIAAGHEARVLARPGSERKVPAGSTAVAGNPLNVDSFRDRISPSTTFVHLVGVSHPAPWKEREFRAVDHASVAASVAAVRPSGIVHFVYVSVAHPAPVMTAYWKIRAECEAMIGDLGIATTILRPWYVMGPGHRWPAVLKPLYTVLEKFPATAEGAKRLGLVTLPQMVAALCEAVERVPEGLRVVEVEGIRRAGGD